MNVVGMIADHPTPKSKVEGAAYTLNSRDYKGVMLVIVTKEKENGNSSQASHPKRM